MPIHLSEKLHKVTIQAPSGVAAVLEEKLRKKYEVEVEILPDNPKVICKIMARKHQKWITICTFASDETIKDIITMFEVNFQLRK